MSKGLKIAIVIAVIVALIFIFGVRFGTCKYCGNSGILIEKSVEFAGTSARHTACPDCWNQFEYIFY